MSQHPPLTSAEARNSQRKRVYRGVKIILNEGSSVVDGALRDVSERGACIRLNSFCELPRQFSLQFFDNTRCDCEVRWRRQHDIGVAFLNAPALTKKMGSSQLASWGIYRETEKINPVNVLRTLKLEGYFGDENLKARAAEFELAFGNFIDALKPYFSTPGEDSP